MEFSNSLKQRFVKDYKLQFQVVQEPMFSYYMTELDKHFDTQAKLEMLTDVVNTLGGEDGFFKESNRVKDTLIQAIQAKPAYEKLQNDRLDGYDTVNQVKQQDIYNMGNVNKTFISVDLKHANFNVFKMYDPELTLGFGNYEALVGSVTEFEYFKKSKYLRQVIFGNMLPKKQQRLQKWVMDKVITVLHTDVGVEMKDFMSASADEVVFAVDPSNVDKFVDMVARKLGSNDLTTNFAYWCRVEAFTLKSVGNKKFFVKENCLNGEVEFKATPSLLFMQVYKQYVGEELDPMDKVFYHEGFLAEFKDLVFEDLKRD